MRTHINIKTLLGATGCGLAMLAASALVSCSSDDEILPEPEAPQATAGKIGYNVVSDNASRATQIYNSTSIPTSFHVSAWVVDSVDNGNREYIKWDLIKDLNPKGAHDWEDQDGVRYWPVNGARLNFFATTAPQASFGDVEKNVKYEIPFTVNADAEGQSDLLYATAFNQHKTASGLNGQASQKVNLTFHHALSQVVFTGQCTNPHMLVYIGGVSVAGISGQGTMTIDALNDTVTPKWTLSQTVDNAAYSASSIYSNGAVTLGSEVTNVTAGPNQTAEALMLLPQTVAGANPAEADPWNGSKAYLKVDCMIFNQAKGSEGQSYFDTMIFGKDDGTMTTYDTLYIPLDVSWQPGKRYVYNLIFGQGNGGYHNDGSAALIPVKYDIQVDNWIEGGSQDVNEQQF